MHIIVYQHTEPPLILNHVYRIEEEMEGDIIIIYDSVDGRLEMRSDDIMKFEGPNGDD